MSTFHREERYIVIKRKNMSEVEEGMLRTFLYEYDIPTTGCVVIEEDWPEYELVWKMVEERCAKTS